jgi:hypothetical protein
MTETSVIPTQVRLPLRVALGVVRQGIRIRLGRSLVTLTGVMLGITFLMSTLTSQALKGGVAEEDRLREDASRMYGYLVAETGPLLDRPLALIVTGPLSGPEERLLTRLAAEGIGELRVRDGLVVDAAVPVKTLSDARERGRDVPAVLVLGGKPVAAGDWDALFSQARRRVVAFTAGTAPNVPGANVISLSRPRGDDERARIDAERTSARFRGAFIVVVSLLVTVIGISNAMLMSVTERFRDIGTMKCLGALSSFVRTIFLLEASFMGAVGGTFGVVLGFFFAVGSYLVPYGLDLALIALGQHPGQLALAALGSLVAGIGLSVVAALYPATLAARMVPADALRSNV